ncbi:hypothetical protein AAES_109613 [Amazona aestiva]|uniref:Uncharacterized protein n=1 Tax=Amazona aestiva TaxID=12930 RepID=A0A0Q3USL6_AMAAE|nr:hypothetical protein AAES_109613 [Amazona aestiva]
MLGVCTAEIVNDKALFSSECRACEWAWMILEPAGGRCIASIIPGNRPGSQQLLKPPLPAGTLRMAPWHSGPHRNECFCPWPDQFELDIRSTEVCSSLPNKSIPEFGLQRTAQAQNSRLLLESLTFLRRGNAVKQIDRGYVTCEMEKPISVQNELMHKNTQQRLALIHPQ